MYMVVFMNVLVDAPKIWELLAGFKKYCQLKGWKTSEYEDSINVDGEYHNFLWIRSLQPSTFEKIAAIQKCVISKGLSYEMVDVSYTAWLLGQRPSSKIMQTIRENEDLLKQNAIYDIRWADKGSVVCGKMNKTKSLVFYEFEKFLENKWKFEFQPYDSSV